MSGTGVAATAYDEVRYPGKFYPQSSAEHLATLARLHGLDPAPPGSARVLELGCGDGGNLIPQAVQFPQARFVGVDLAASAIEEGRRTIDTLGLRNIELVTANIAAFDPGSEPFDYIAAHGVLSWVPLDVRQALLALCGHHLAAQGVAYVSYSALPGGYLRQVPRDLMRFHTRHISTPAEKVRAAREAVDFMRAAQPDGSFARQLVEREMVGTEGKDYFLRHDLLADENEPLYFVDFVDAAGEVGLQFLCEAEWAAMSTAAFPPSVRQRLDQLASRVEREQYLDFLKLRRFRQTLLCRQGLAPDPVITPDRLSSLYFSTRARPVAGEPDPSALGTLEFQHPLHGRFRADEPASKALALALTRGDARGIRFAELEAVVDRVLGQMDTLVTRDAPQTPATPDASRRGAILRSLMSLFERDLIEIHTTRWDYETEASARPRTTAYARLLAERGAPVVNARLGTFHLPSETLRRIVTLLDGSRTIDDLADALTGLTSAAEPDGVKPLAVRQRLQLLADNAMLVG